MQFTYNNIYFQYGGNAQPWVIFRKWTETVVPTNIVLWSQTIQNCTQRIQWAYYNPARGNRLRPLDPDTLNQQVATENLLGLPQTYGQLSLYGWLYTNCQTNPDAVYGYIRHLRSWSTEFELLAGVQVDFVNNTYNNSFESNITLDTGNREANGFIFDPLWGIASIGTPPICGNGIIETGETCDDNNTDSGDWCSSTCQIETGRQCSGEPSQCTLIQTPPPTNNQGTGTFNARLQFPSLYTNTQFVNGLIYVTEPAGYIIQGDTQGTFAGTLANTTNTNIILSAWEWLKTLDTTFTSIQSGIVITGTAQITLDTTPPTLNITNPTSGDIVSWSVQVSRDAEDTAGIANTHIQIYQSNTLIYSNITQSNTHTINTIANGEYTLHITTYDKAGNSTTKTITFSINNSPVPSNWSITWFNAITGANKDTIYLSNPIIIAWLPTGTSVTGSIDTGTLAKNGNDVGTQASFTNGDVLRIARRSANQYNTQVQTNLNINNTIIPFSITTKTSENDIENNQGYCSNENTYALIFLSLKESYESEERLRQVLQLMLTMINDLITVTANQWGWQSIYALQCFADIVDEYLIQSNTGPEINENQWIYTAPNGKEYLVEYLPNIDAYTSPDFAYHKIFVDYEMFTKHIDANNPSTTSRNHTVDPSFTPVVYTAPNGKKYTLQKTDKWFMSYQFLVPAYFQTLEGTKAHIDRHNPQ